MKELSIEEKAKRYDEAIERARTEYKNHEAFKGFCEMLVNIFPELKELEDERIRKELIQFFSDKDEEDYEGMHPRAQIVAWLEKQSNTFTKKDVDDAYLKGVCDAKHELEKQGERKPTIEMKSAEESLGIDSDTYTKIVDECIFGEQKPAWSEEELDNITAAINNLEYFKKNCVYHPMGLEPAITFLKSLKDRVQFKREWSESDKDFMYDTLSNLTELKDRYGEGYGNVGKCIEWLKSLRPQNRWKPSDEQMEALWEVYKGGEEQAALASLYSDLKKLREE